MDGKHQSFPENSPLKTLLNSPHKLPPAVPIPDWTAPISPSPTVNIYTLFIQSLFHILVLDSKS